MHAYNIKKPNCNAKFMTFFYNFPLQFTTTVTKSFIDYVKNHPIVFEVFGHYQQHPLHDQARAAARYTR